MLTPREVSSINQRLFETSQDVILVTDGYGTIVHVSPSSATLLGYRPEELIGRSAVDIIYPDDLELTRNEMRAVRRGQATRNFRCRYVHKEGHAVALFWMGVWSEPDRHYFFVGRDMTEHDHTEAQLRQAQKMEAVGQLTGGLAHDFNNILMVVMASIDAIEEEEPLTDGLRQHLLQIGGAAQRAADLTRQLLAFSRQQPLAPRPTNLNDIVTATVRLIRRTLPENVEIATVLADDLWTTSVDRTQFESALVNLCINARDAMAAGGKLLLETRNVVLDSDYVALNPDATEGEQVMVTVTDTGTGIPAENLTKVFEPFFTTKAVGHGTGLGLSMVYGFIKQSNGHIKVYSEVGRGTSVKLYLPRSDGTPSQAETSAATAIPTGSERILVVEDDAGVRGGVVRQLRSLGYAVDEAGDGAAGLDAFATAHRPYDLLLTDVVMSGPLGGKALADEVSRRWPGIPVVYMSGYTEDAIVHHGRLDSEVRLLSKPFRRSDLARMIRDALDDVD